MSNVVTCEVCKREYDPEENVQWDGNPMGYCVQVDMDDEWIMSFCSPLCAALFFANMAHASVVPVDDDDDPHLPDWAEQWFEQHGPNGSFEACNRPIEQATAAPGEIRNVKRD